MWESVALALGATAGNSIGKVLQKKATLILPPLSLQLKVIREYVFNTAWMTGFVLDIGGALLMLRALSLAPVSHAVRHLGSVEFAETYLIIRKIQSSNDFSEEFWRKRSQNITWFGYSHQGISKQVSVIQPISGCGLAILSIFSHFYLKELMNVVDWMGIALAGIGTIGVGVGGDEQKASTISIFHLPWLVVIVAVVFGILNGWLRIYRWHTGEQELMPSEVVEEVILGLEAGILFGMEAVLSKLGFVLLEQGYSMMSLLLCIALSLCCAASGFFYQTRGLKHGRAIVVSTSTSVASIVFGVLAGMFALGERLPTAPRPRFLLLRAWLLIIVGVIFLVTSTRLAQFLPRTIDHSMQCASDKSISFELPKIIVTSDPNPSATIEETTLLTDFPSEGNP